MVDKCEWTVNYKHFTGNVFRQKTYNQQDLSSYIHKEFWQLCPYFSQVYFLISCDLASKYVFPEFAKKALSIKKDGKVESQVSEYWKSLFEELCFVQNWTKEEKRQKLSARRKLETKMGINRFVTGHSAKKASAQDMAEAGFCALGIIFRCGWLVRNQHSVFDYIHNKLKLVQQGGKILAGWKVKFGDDYFGGYSPTLDAVSTGKDLLTNFAYLLLASHPFVTDEKKEILVAVLLHYYRDFCAALKAHPQEIFENLLTHTVCAKIEMARKICKISIEMFESWQDDIRSDFLSKNMLALDLKGLNGVMDKDADKLFVDPRCMLEQFFQMVHHIGVLEKFEQYKGKNGVY